jgi:hypothetical protein
MTRSNDCGQTNDEETIDADDLVFWNDDESQSDYEDEDTDSDDDIDNNTVDSAAAYPGTSAIFKILQARPAILQPQLRRPAASTSRDECRSATNHGRHDQQAPPPPDDTEDGAGCGGGGKTPTTTTECVSAFWGLILLGEKLAVRTSTTAITVNVCVDRAVNPLPKAESIQLAKTIEVQVSNL